MNRTGAVVSATVAIFSLAAGCGPRLTPSVEREISTEADRLRHAERQIETSSASLESGLAQFAQLFQGTPDVAEWKRALEHAKTDLRAAEDDNRQLAIFVEKNRSDPSIGRLIADERKNRDLALRECETVDQSLGRWLEYGRDPLAFRAKIKDQRLAIRSFDVAPVVDAVNRAEQDWPTKKTVLEGRLSSLYAAATLDVPSADDTPSALIDEENRIAHQSDSLQSQARELQDECDQLYDSWDKILTDLDRAQFGPDTLYRERVKVIRTHLLDVASKKSETHSSESWANVSEAAFDSVEEDIGMTIAHKDAGLFDSEAQTTPQPPGFSYVAAPSAGSNQYGYWSHDGGESVWTFLPEYLILRELLWNHDYRPIRASEYNAYHAAQNRGATYYGRDAATSAPKYGTHGTFTQTHYAGSRYVQSGGFKGSAYSSNGASANNFASRFGEERRPEVGNEFNGGRRFGRQPGSAPSGKQFGRAPGFRPSGRSFGRRR